jgi:hypothetical protein
VKLFIQCKTSLKVPVAAGLRRWFAAARLLRSWVRIPPASWMFVCCECCVLSGRGLCNELITRPEEFYRLWWDVVCDLETSRMRRPWHALGRSATEIIICYIKHLYCHNNPLKFNGFLRTKLSPYMCLWTTKVLNSVHLKDKCWKPCASFCSDIDEIHVRNLQSVELIHHILSEQENVQRRERKRRTRESEVSCRHRVSRAIPIWSLELLHQAQERQLLWRQ